MHKHLSLWLPSVTPLDAGSGLAQFCGSSLVRNNMEGMGCHRAAEPKGLPGWRRAQCLLVAFPPDLFAPVVAAEEMERSGAVTA